MNKAAKKWLKEEKKWRKKDEKLLKKAGRKSLKPAFPSLPAQITTAPVAPPTVKSNTMKESIPDLLADKTDKIAKSYGLNAQQAEALTKVGVREWLVQGSQLIQNEIIPKDIFFLLSSFLVGLSDEDTKKVMTAVHRKLFFGVEDIYIRKFNSGLFSELQYFEKHHHSLKRYNRILKN